MPFFDAILAIQNSGFGAMVSLLVVEDHALVREGLVRTLSQLEPGISVFEACDCDSANALLEQKPDLDLILLDLCLPGLDGLACLASFRKHYPRVPVVILSAYDDPQTISRAMKCGAAGFVPKTYSSDRLMMAVRRVLAGEVFVPELFFGEPTTVLPRFPLGGESAPADFGLTARQAEVLSLMARGKSNRNIASVLGLSEGTVKIHLTAIFKALGVGSRTQAMVVIAQQGIRL
jgi:DNA-binding NarL/FixJ family response regulator